jgi:hypothetical protein
MSQDLISTVHSILTITPARWHQLAQSLPEELLKQRPAPEEWSPLECLQHMIDTEHVFQFRLQAFLDGRPSLPGFNPDTQGGQPASPTTGGLAVEFERLRAQGLAALARLTPADLERKSVHQELGPVTLGEMINEWAAHDFNHTVQAEQALMQPFIRACGPWKEYFSDHLIGQ